MSKELENAWAVQEIWQKKCYELEERIRFLEQCLDNKEKVNKSMREEIRNLNKELEYYKKQCGED